MNNQIPVVTKEWTLFLDRDGVINEEKDQDYIRNKDEFRFYPGVREAIRIFAGLFRHIILVTNQKGIGKGLMTHDDLRSIHQHMQGEIESAAGRIDGIYYCAELDDNHPNRKPNPGMGLQAFKDFPDINKDQCIMVGNTLSDMQFGKSLGMYTIFLSTTRPIPTMPHEWIDLVLPDLLSVAKALQKEDSVK